MLTFEELQALCGHRILFTVRPPNGEFVKPVNETFARMMGFDHRDDLVGYLALSLMAHDPPTEDEQESIRATTELHERVRTSGVPEDYENWIMALWGTPLWGTVRVRIHVTVRWIGAFEESGVILAVESLYTATMFDDVDFEPPKRLSQARGTALSERPPAAKPRGKGYQLPMDLQTNRLLWPPEFFLAMLVDLVFSHVSEAPKIRTVCAKLGEALHVDGKALAPNTVHDALKALANAQDHADEVNYPAATLRRVYAEWTEEEFKPEFG